ncbi:MAG: hypothetical protein ABI705_00430 [Aestuariivirga sp.]
MRRFLLAVCGYSLFGLVALLSVEGGYSIIRWKHADRSIVYDAYRKLMLSVIESSPARLPTASRDEIESLIPDMIKEGVGMGNVPYKQLVTGRASINEIGPEGCRSPRANIQKIMTYIRSFDYDLFDPPSMFFDKQAVLSSGLSQFVDKYAMRKAEFTSNATNERISLPIIALSSKVLVAGASVAAGSMIDDSETISSQMQRQDVTAQYINLGVNGVATEDTICRLKSAAIRYKGQISGLIFIYSENDFAPQEPFGKSQEVLAWLKEYAARENISKVTIVFAPYIYNIIPNLTRFPGTRGADHGTFLVEVDNLKKEVAEAGFNFVNIGDMAMEEAVARHTDFAAFALFVDHAHLSDYGVSKLVKKLQAF